MAAHYMVQMEVCAQNVLCFLCEPSTYYYLASNFMSTGINVLLLKKTFAFVTKDGNQAFLGSAFLYLTGGISCVSQDISMQSDFNQKDKGANRWKV